MHNKKNNQLSVLNFEISKKRIRIYSPLWIEKVKPDQGSCQLKKTPPKFQIFISSVSRRVWPKRIVLSLKYWGRITDSQNHRYCKFLWKWVMEGVHHDILMMEVINLPKQALNWNGDNTKLARLLTVNVKLLVRSRTWQRLLKTYKIHSKIWTQPVK